jgi:hypothetical protein
MEQQDRNDSQHAGNHDQQGLALIAAHQGEAH